MPETLEFQQAYSDAEFILAYVRGKLPEF